MRFLWATLGAALVLGVAGCGGSDDAGGGGGLEARLFETDADEVFAGPAGVFALDGADLMPIDTESGDPDGQPIETELLNTRVAVGEGVIWVTASAEQKAIRVDLTGPIEPLEVPGGEPSLVVADGAGAWIVSGDDLVAYRADGTPGDPLRLPCEVNDLAASGGTVWGGCKRGLVRVDTSGRTAQLVDVGGEPKSVAAVAGAAWALVGDRLVRVDDDGDSEPVVDAPKGAARIAGEGETLWVFSSPEGDRKAQLVTRHDARTGKQEAGPVELPGSTDDVGAAAAAAAPYRGALWFTLAFYGGPLGVVDAGGG